VSRALGGLTTRGRCLLAGALAAALCGLLLGERDLLRVAAFAAVLPLLATLVAGRAEIGLRSARELVPPRIPAGEVSEVRLGVRCTGRLGSGLLLEDGVPAELGKRPRFVVAQLPRRGAVRLRYPLRPELRGVYPVGPLVARITDPFGLAEYDRELAGRSTLVVTPVVLALSDLPGGPGTQPARATGTEGAGRLRSGAGTDAVVVRSYQQGDDLRKVHWRSTARRDELMVRVEERPWHGGAAVLLDHRAAAHRGAGPGSSLECAVSLAASVCVHLHQLGRRVRLLTAEGRVLAGGPDAPAAGGTEVLLDALAVLRPSAHRAVHTAPTLDGGADLVAVLGSASPADLEQLLRHRPRGLRSHAVLLDVAAWAGPAAAGGACDPAEAQRLLVAAGWSVVVAGPDEPIASVWRRLCAESRSKQTALR
jgi:uncharacterized protein (DUF58 family)